MQPLQLMSCISETHQRSNVSRLSLLTWWSWQSLQDRSEGLRVAHTTIEIFVSESKIQILWSVFYLQSNGSWSSWESSGSFVTFSSKRPLLASRSKLSISTLHQKTWEILLNTLKLKKIAEFVACLNKKYKLNQLALQTRWFCFEELELVLTAGPGWPTGPIGPGGPGGPC